MLRLEAQMSLTNRWCQLGVFDKGSTSIPLQPFEVLVPQCLLVKQG
jgi:hypothetical protein